MTVTKAFQLDEIGKQHSLSMAFSVDGTNISKNFSMVVGGLKVTDREAQCPFSQWLILQDPANMKAQLQNLMHPLKLMIGSEMCETYSMHLKDLFEFMDSLSDETTLPAAIQDLNAWIAMVNCDLSAAWKGLGKGGAAKQHELSCTCCDTVSNDLARPNPHTCGCWCTDHEGNNPNGC
jgi:hypothetical protein